MNIKHILSVFSISFILAAWQGCSDRLDINADPNAPTDVAENLILPAILSNFSYEVIGGYPVRTTSLWTKHLASSVPPTHVGQYRLSANDVNNFWRTFSYIDVMQNCKVLIDKAAENENYNYSAIAKIIFAWNMSLITDCYGDAPMSDAFRGIEGIIKPKYDSQESIYEQIQLLLDQAIEEAGRGVGLEPGTDDFVYGGDMESWQRLARTLKARFYLRLSYAPGYSAETQANLALQALNAGAISADQIPTFQYFSGAGSENPWYQYAIDGKWDTRDRPSQYYVNFLKETDDPRLAFQVTQVSGGENDGEYVGVNNYATPLGVTNYSQIHPFYSAADAPLYWLVYAEVPFIRAEAEFLRAGRIVTPAVIEAYNDGVVASMEFYGISVSDYAAYLAINVLSPTPATAYEQIMTQKYIANYLQFESYNDYRRTGYPDLPLNTELYPGDAALEDAANPVIPVIPVRFPYPSSERAYNQQNIPSNIPAGSLDAMVIPVWWDND